MREVFFTADNIYSPLGTTTEENFKQLKTGKEGVRLHENKHLSESPFYASLFKDPFPGEVFPGFTPFEQLLALSISDVLSKSDVPASDKKTILIISSTKGNISLLETGGPQFSKSSAIGLHQSAQKLASWFNFYNSPLVVSSACISGVLGLITGKRLIESGKFDTAIVAGADLITSFVYSGFQSFQALSDQVCRPFDASRKGINLGEGAGTVLLSAESQFSGDIKLSGGAVTNDANHISGPSRTGEELYLAIRRAMTEAGISGEDVGYISAHGTATVYNDEMEAKAITLAELQNVPVNSLKGYFGHTLGGAGLIETIIAKESMLKNVIIPTPGYKESGVSTPINVCNELSESSFSHCLKTSSGFGGCNAAITLSK